MLFPLVFGIVGIVIWVVAGVLIYLWRRQLRKTELMRRVGTSSAAEAAGASPGTLVEVIGILRCENPLTSEMAGQTCAYYLSQVIREYMATERKVGGGSRTTRHSETLSSNEQFAPFAVEDRSGAVGVRGEGAEVDALEVMNRFERESGGVWSMLRAALGRGNRTLGYRHVESILRVDEPVYVLGVVQADGQIGAPTEEEDREKRFLISYRSEEGLEKKYKRDALMFLLTALGLFLMGVGFVAVGVATAIEVI